MSSFFHRLQVQELRGHLDESGGREAREGESSNNCSLAASMGPAAGEVGGKKIWETEAELRITRLPAGQPC